MSQLPHLIDENDDLAASVSAACAQHTSSTKYLLLWEGDTTLGAMDEMVG